MPDLIDARRRTVNIYRVDVDGVVVSFLPQSYVTWCPVHGSSRLESCTHIRAAADFVLGNPPFKDGVVHRFRRGLTTTSTRIQKAHEPA